MRPEIAEAFGKLDLYRRPKLLKIREIILLVAAKNPKVGALEEVIRWGQVSCITIRSGSIIRIDAPRKHRGPVAIYFHCQTTLVSVFRSRFGSKLRYEGNRAVLFAVDKALPVKAIEWCVSMALTYNLAKNHGRIPIGNQIK